MSGREQPMTELELDVILRDFVGEGADAPPQRLLEHALSVVDRTRQVRPPVAMPRWRTTGRAVSAWGAAAAALLVVTLSFIVLKPNRPATPTLPVNSPSATPSADGMTLVGSAEQGFEILVPTAWEERSSDPGSWKWAGPDGSLMVSYGQSVLQGGGTYMCGPVNSDQPACSTQAFSYSVPFDPAVDGVAPLSITGFVKDRCAGGCDVTTSETILDGEKALRSQTTAARTLATYVSTFHNRRPVVLYWSGPAAAGEDTRIEQMRSSFKFIDPLVVDPTAFVDPTELVVFTDSEAGYEIRVPRFWSAGKVEEQFPSVHEWGAGRGFGTHGHPAFAISVGEPDGSVVVCQGTAHECTMQVARSLDELDALLVAVAITQATAGPVETKGDLTLAGVPGRFKTPTYVTASEGCLGCPGMLYHAYTIVDGRPVIISFDWWVWRWELTEAYAAEIIQSFRLRAAPTLAATGSADLFRIPFAYGLPAGWQLATETSHEVMFTEGAEAIRIVDDARPTACGELFNASAPHAPADLVAAMRGRPFMSVSSSAVTVGGLSGLQIDLMIRPGEGLESIYQMTDRNGQCGVAALGAGLHRLYALDDGAGKTILIQVTGSNAGAGSEARVILESLAFTGRGA